MFRNSMRSCARDPPEVRRKSLLNTTSALLRSGVRTRSSVRGAVPYVYGAASEYAAGLTQLSKLLSRPPDVEGSVPVRFGRCEPLNVPVVSVRCETLIG